MMFKTSVIFEKNYSSTAKIVINQGGTSSGKTYSILQCLFLKCIEMEPELNNKVVTIVGQDIPNLKSGALRDAQNILNTSPELQKWVQSYNSTERIFTFVNGATMEFKSFDDGQDAKSGKRMFAFFNEGCKFRIIFCRLCGKWMFCCYSRKGYPHNRIRTRREDM